ncbi:hypothetical protein [Actinophytocola sp. KF-1]
MADHRAKHSSPMSAWIASASTNAACACRGAGDVVQLAEEGQDVRLGEAGEGECLRQGGLRPGEPSAVLAVVEWWARSRVMASSTAGAGRLAARPRTWSRMRSWNR